MFNIKTDSIQTLEKRLSELLVSADENFIEPIDLKLLAAEKKRKIKK